MASKSSGAAIAVVGLACRFPGARSPRELWENVLARRRQFRRFPDCRLPLAEYHDPAPRAPDMTYATRGAFIDGFEFDWVGRRVPQRTFESTDIVHWLALETALGALADAGYTPESVPTERSAVLVGNSLTGEQSRTWTMRLRWPYVRRALRTAAASRGLQGDVVGELESSMEEVFKSVFPPVTEDTLAGVLSNTIPGRICNFLDFQGGGYTVDGACASGMIAVATAANGLANGELDFALAGGVDMSLDAIELIGFAKVGALTRDDITVYDRRGSGFLPGEGCGFVALKRLDDARRDGDDVYAVIRGWGISSDGRGGLTAPRADSQSKMLIRAYERAGYSPHELTFVEGHGTATVAGDKAELEGIQQALEAFGSPPARSVGMTSAKSLIGHTKAASGLLGFIKTVMAVNRRVVPPTAACRDPNPVFVSSARALYPIRRGEVRDPSEAIRAGVSAMGFGGINCHVTLESGDAPSPKLEPSLDERRLVAAAQDTELFAFAAESVDALLARVRELVPIAEQMSVAELVDLAAELTRETTGRVRAAVVAGSAEELAERLRALAALLESSPPAEGDVAAAGPDVLAGHATGEPRVGFLFPGQGSQRLDMARSLVERFPWAASAFERAESVLAEAGAPPVRELVFRPLERVPSTRDLEEWQSALAQTEAAQPAICLASLLWLERLRRLGVAPAAVAGHSLGELTALHAAGAFDADALLRLAAERGNAMAAPAGEAGTMAALRCSRERAAELVERASGYAVVANANAPEQTVISGERATVDEVVALAQAEEIEAIPLAVSNAFHSRLVEGAADRIRSTSAVPEQPASLDAVVVTGVDGSEASAELALREHLATQLVSPVDFVALARGIAARTDVLLEVGPGRVLSGLARSILGADGPPCLPVSSEPDRDRDLNAALAELFVRGASIDWDELYDGRLVRPFVPASELRFFVNPVEQPFPSELEHGAPLAVSGGVLEARLAASAGLAADDVRRYLDRRAPFLAQVIRADLESSGDAPAAAVAAPPDPSRVAAPAGDASTRLVALASELTGFPVDSIPLEARLLDDLNLDSIKAAELVGRVADELGITAELDLAEFANASLREIAARLGGASAGPVSDPFPVLVEVVARHTGFPAETIGAGLRLLDDLNLDSIKAAEVVLEAAGELGIAEESVPEPSEFANATLGEIAAALAGAGVPRAAARDALAGRRSAVRAYVLEDVPVDEAVAAELGAARALVVGADAESLASALRERGADVTVASEVDEASLAGATHVVVLLGGRPELEGVARATMERLRAVATPPDGATLAFVASANARDSLARSFAASLHHERGDLRIRVVEIAAETPVAAVLAELTTPERFAISSYDAAGRRHAPRARPLERVELPERAQRLGSGDVVLVTGGARGITAECALGLARATGATMALVGSSGEERAAETLGRFASAGLTARYYRCDVTDGAAVAALVARVRDELGPVAAVVHGAGANVARRVDQTTVDDAVAEAAPKLAGATNLAAALDDAPPRLFVGLSSVTAVTGMPGNAWYGFANEGLEAVLRRFGERHPETATLAIAFGLWEEVGMAAHAGDQLARMGLGTIPVEDGVGHFVDLVERDPGADRVVVSARLRGLDTWSPARPELPAASGFLELPVHVDPGVEVVARSEVSTERDPALADHVHRGTVLFPTVYGLEAMAQAVAWVLGEHELPPLRIENVQLARPLVVEDAGTTIEVRAEVVERTAPEDRRRVRASIGCEATGFAADHFSAEFVLDAPTGATEPVDVPDRPIPLVPARDLYGPLLFHGPAFQRLERVHHLTSAECLVDVRVGRAAPGDFLLGDPIARDALLQTTQLMVPQSHCLPVEIGAIELHAVMRNPGTMLARAVYEGRADGHENARVTALDDDGRVLERIVGFKAKILETQPDQPTAEELADPSTRDAELLRRALASHAGALGVRTPEVAFARVEGMHDLSSDERHELERPLFSEVVARALSSANGGG